MARKFGTLNGEKVAPSINDIHIQKMKWYPYITLFTEIILKWFKDLNVRLETIKLLDENMGEIYLTLVLETVLWILHQSTSNKSKNKQLGLQKIKKFLHRKRNNCPAGVAQQLSINLGSRRL